MPLRLPCLFDAMITPLMPLITSISDTLMLIDADYYFILRHYAALRCCHADMPLHIITPLH